MKCERVKELFPDYLVGELADGLRTEMQAHIAECAPCREEVHSSEALWEKLSSLPAAEPTPAMDARFQAMLNSARRKLDAEKEAPSPRDWLGRLLEGLWPRQPALQFGLAIALFAMGLLLGPALFRSTRIQTAEDPAVAGLRQEVSGLKQMVALALLKEPSASERLRGVGWSSRLSTPDEDVLTALLQALDSDPNVNVRIAAVQALQQFAGRSAVKKGLLASLPRQQSPLVQLELIRLLVQLQDKESVPVLRTLLKDNAVNPTVRESAEWGVQELGGGQNI